jgi:hypothetical protein
MNRRTLTFAAALTVGAFFVTGCNDGNKTAGTASPQPSSTAADLPNSGAPKVDNPLPAKVLDGSPCDTALTTEQLTGFLGEPSAPKAKDEVLGPSCTWTSASGSGAGILVGYETKTGQGISLTYKNEKPKADRWVDDLQPVQGYPVVGYVEQGIDPADKRDCVITVGVSDELAFSISLILGDKSAAAGKDACQLGRGVADTVLTNLKARA